MTLNKKKWQGRIVITLLFLTAWMFRFPLFNLSVIPFVGAVCGLLRPLIYMGLFVGWSIAVAHTIINRRLKIYLQSMAGCSIFWMFLRTIKYELTFRGDSVNIFLMYACYIPFILIPTLGFFASLHVRRGERYNSPKPVYVAVSGVSLVALLFVFTNPFHKLYWTDTPDGAHGAGYVVVVFWILFLMTAGLINIILRAKIPGKPAVAVLPLIVIAIIGAYYAMYAFFPKVWKFVSNDWNSFTCLASIALMQACITSGLLPSNRGYAGIFEASDKGIIITDDDWKVCYTSARAEVFSKDILRKTEAGVFEKDQNTLLKGAKLHPGHVVWKEDISAVAAILEELEKNKKELTAKNELDRENNLAELALAHAQEKNRLYDLSQAACAKQNKLLQEMLTTYFVETNTQEKMTLLAKASVLGAYIKRKGNLLFAGAMGTVKASELHLCFNESISNIELLQADCHMDFSLPDEKELPLEKALLLYDSFERATTALLPDLRAVFIRVTEDEENLRAIYSLESSLDLSADDFPHEASCVRDQDTWVVSLTIPKGGDVR